MCYFHYQLVFLIYREYIKKGVTYFLYICLEFEHSLLNPGQLSANGVPCKKSEGLRGVLSSEI